MIKRISLGCVFIIACNLPHVFAKEIEKKYLLGQLFSLDKNGREHYLDGIEVKIPSENIGSLTENGGNFRIELPDRLKGGDKVIMAIKKPGWSMLSPYRGELYLPRNWRTEYIKVRIIPTTVGLNPMVYYANKVSSVDNISSGYRVQVIVTSSKIKADTFVRILRSKKLEARAELITLNNKRHYQVSTGPYETKPEALRVKKQLIESTDLPDDIFVPQ